MIDYHGLAPEIVLAVTIAAVLVLDLVPIPKYWTAVAGLTGLFAAVVPILTLGVLRDETIEMLGGSYVVDDFALILKALFIGTGFISLLLAVGFVESDRYYQSEFYFLLLASVLGAVVMSSSRDLLTLFIGLELVTAPAFLLAGWRKGDARSNEAALKFFIVGVLSATILVFGMSLIYGTTEEITFEGIRNAVAAADLTGEPAFVLGLLFIIVGFGFKVAAVPFHFWAPDTYEGAPIPVAAYLSVGSKAAGFVGLLSVCFLAFADARDIWGPAIWILAALSMTVGNLVALRQNDVVRLLGYSSIAHGGFILVPFAMAATYDGAGLEEAFFATVTYLLIYAFMNLGAFAAVMAVTDKTGDSDVGNFAGLFGYAPGLATALAVFFFSLAGIPPLAGWFAKLVMFRAVLNDTGTWGAVLAALAAVNAVIAFYYYARVVKAVWMDPAPETLAVPEASERPLAPSLGLAMGIAVVAVILVGIFPQLLAFFGDATKAIAAGL